MKKLTEKMTKMLRDANRSPDGSILGCHHTALGRCVDNGRHAVATGYALVERGLLVKTSSRFCVFKITDAGRAVVSV